MSMHEKRNPGWRAGASGRDAGIGRLPSQATATIPEIQGRIAAGSETDLANAHRIAEHFGERLLFVEGIGWHVWNPPWRHDELAAREIVHGLGRIIDAEAEGMDAWVEAASDVAEMRARKAAQQARQSWARKSEASARITAAMLEAQPLLRCRAEDLDADVMRLGVQNGVIELDSGLFREYRPDDLITKTCGVEFEPTSGCDEWLTFMHDAMGGDRELLDFMQALSGYMLTGQRGEHVLPVFYGSGANGKTTLVGALQHVLGDYASTAPPGLLIQRSGNEHPTGLASLQGRRLVVASETGEGGKLAEAQVKALTGGDRIAARRMHQNFFEFDPTHQIVLLTNHKPTVAGTDEGIWRRLRLVPFNVTVPPEKRDTGLPDKLRAEGSGILNWCLHGLRKYRAGGLPTPEAVRIATAEYRSASDQVGSFLAECTAQGPGQVYVSALYAAYEQWCRASGETGVSKNQLSERMAERGTHRKRDNRGPYWLGLRLIDTTSEYRRTRDGE